MIRKNMFPILVLSINCESGKHAGKVLPSFTLMCFETTRATYSCSNSNSAIVSRRPFHNTPVPKKHDVPFLVSNAWCHYIQPPEVAWAKYCTHQSTPSNTTPHCFRQSFFPRGKKFSKRKLVLTTKLVGGFNPSGKY